LSRARTSSCRPETAEELYYNKERLLANGDRWEREIARNLVADAPYGIRAASVAHARHAPSIEPCRRSGGTGLIACPAEALGTVLLLLTPPLAVAVRLSLLGLVITENSGIRLPLETAQLFGGACPHFRRFGLSTDHVVLPD
jgi:hypothetical protein